MIWLIQDNMNFSALENNTRPLIKVLDKLKQPWRCIGVVPFSHEITGLQPNDKDQKVIFYGSTLLDELIAARPEFSPGVFYKAEWFDPMYAANHRSDMLNSNITLSTVGELRKNWVAEPKFIKSCQVKIFPGMVVEPEESYLFTDEYADVPDETIITVSDVYNIEQEWRFFIVDNKIVAGSSYKKNGYHCKKEPINDKIWREAAELAAGWLPNSEIVMDIAQMRDGTFKIVEWNSLNASGGYNVNWKNIVQALNEKFDK